MTYRKRYARREPFGASRRAKERQGGLLLVTFLQSGLCVFMITAAFFLSSIMGMTEIKTAYNKLATDETDAVAVFSSVKKAVESEKTSKLARVIEIILNQILPNVYNDDGKSLYTDQQNGRGSPIITHMTLPLKGKITSGFGARENPVTGKDDWHTGIDIAAPEGTPIYAARAGEVCFVGSDSIYGNFVTIDHGDFKTRYCHCSSVNVKAGSRINQGELIAFSGSTGMVTGPHLHFEVITDQGCTDPLKAQYIESI